LPSFDEQILARRTLEFETGKQKRIKKSRSHGPARLLKGLGNRAEQKEKGFID